MRPRAPLMRSSSAESSGRLPGVTWGTRGFFMSILFLEADRGDHLAPLRLLRGKKRGVVLRCSGGGEAPDLGELLHHRSGLEGGHGGGMDATLDVRRRRGRDDKAVPVVGSDVRIIPFGGRRHI